MSPEAFLEYGVHFCNFSPDHLDEVINWEGVEDLPDTPFNQEVMLLLSQYMVGNVSGTFDEICEMDFYRRRNCILAWLDVLDQSEHREVCLHVMEFLLPR